MEQVMMSNQHAGSSTSAATSPSNQPFPQDFFPLDFLSFVESTSPSLGMNGIPDFSLPSPGASQQPQQQQSQNQLSLQLSPGFDGLRGNSSFSPSEATPPSRAGNFKGRSRSNKAPRKSGTNQTGQTGRKGTSSQNGIMEVDQDGGMNTDGGINVGENGQMSQGEIALRMAQIYGMQGIDGMEGMMDGYGQLTGLSQGMLQQFEGIHMQSPIVFDPSNPSQAYNPLAQFLASPQMQSGERQKRGNSISLLNGLITPGASTEMYAQTQAEQMMSPMQLEMLARREQMEGMPDLNMAPLLSPALNHNSSQYPSPAMFPSFPATQTPLEALQEQSRQFQDQLNALQVQQRQLQATAAAVAASQNTAQSSPYLSSGPGVYPSSGSSGNSRLVTTPGMGGSTETSPQYFTPLTSPALEATRHFNAFGQPRPPHPLSALSSPALNPLRSAGGAQQTLSPALDPQSNADLSDPDYIRALVGMFDQGPSNGNTYQQGGHSSNGQSSHRQQYQSPSLGAQMYPPTMQQGGYQSSSSHQDSPITSSSGQLGTTPILGPNNGTTGPHRHSLPAKSRPSPLVKPVNHRSHIRHPSTHQSFSQPSSPAVLKGIQPGTYLPAAAMGDRYSSNRAEGGGGSLASTPSPVDLTSMMPPPPVPIHHAQKGLTPMTPAALMNLGGGAGGRRQVLPRLETQAAAPGAAGGTRSAGGQKGAAKKSTAAASAHAGSASGSSGSTLGAAGTPATTGKKGGKSGTGKKLAAKAPGVGVRAATKGAAAAAIAQQTIPEPETRKSSHKAAEQKRRDSLKAGFDELRLLLPPINTEALDPESGEPIPGSSAPRLLPKSLLVPDDNPNRGVSKVALLKFSNEYIVKLHEKVDRRDNYIENLRMEIDRLRGRQNRLGMDDGEEIMTEEGIDLLEFDIRLGEEEYEDDVEGEGEGDEDLEGRSGSGSGSGIVEGGEEQEEEDEEEEDEELMMDEDEAEEFMAAPVPPPKIAKKTINRHNSINAGAGKKSGANGTGAMAAAAAAALVASGGKRPPVGRSTSSGSTITGRNRRGE